jgi:hypothetical protein
MIAGTPNWEPMPDSQFVSHATPCGATRSAMSAMTFSNTTMYTSRAMSCGVTQLLVALRSLERPKELVLANIV